MYQRDRDDANVFCNGSPWSFQKFDQLPCFLCDMRSPDSAAAPKPRKSLQQILVRTILFDRGIDYLLSHGAQKANCGRRCWCHCPTRMNRPSYLSWFSLSVSFCLRNHIDKVIADLRIRETYSVPARAVLGCGSITNGVGSEFRSQLLFRVVGCIKRCRTLRPASA